jgi:hypothetical protein
MSVPIITAERARKLAEEKEQILRVMEIIWQLAIEGERFVILDNLYERTINELEAYGYQIEERLGLTDNPSYYISWK